MEVYLKSQCRKELKKVAEKIEEKFDDSEKSNTEDDDSMFSKPLLNGKGNTDPYLCPIKDCGESFPSKFSSKTSFCELKLIP